MTPLRQRMLNDMTVRGLAENTKRPYLSAVTGLARHYRHSPDSVSAQPAPAAAPFSVRHRPEARQHKAGQRRKTVKRVRD